MRSIIREAPRSILVRAVNWIGDAVMTTPAIGAVRDSFPDSEITILANPLVAQLFSPHPCVDRVLVFDRNARHRGVAGTLRLANELRRKHFDAAIILPNSFGSALVPWLAGIPVRLGKSSDGRGFMLSGRYNEGKPPAALHEIDHYLRLVNHFGIRDSGRGMCLETTDDENASAASLLAASGIDAGRFVIGINPGATFGSAKRWYPDRFAEAAQRLSSEYSAAVVIFGGRGEADIAGEIERRLDGRCVNLAGKTTVRELMALVRRCDLFITNDSGPMHIAAAFGVPLVAVFGPTDDSGTSPRTENAVVIRKDTECAPCKLRECPTDHHCMTAISADDVVKAVSRLNIRHSGPA